jgi:hypothetical protein
MIQSNFFVFIKNKNKNYELKEIFNTNNLNDNFFHGNYIHPITYHKDGIESVFKMGLNQIKFLKNKNLSSRDDKVIQKYFKDEKYQILSTSTDINGVIDLFQVSSQNQTYVFLVNYIIDSTNIVTYESTNICEFCHTHALGITELKNMSSVAREVTSLSAPPMIEETEQQIILNNEIFQVTTPTSFEIKLLSTFGKLIKFARNNYKTLSIITNEESTDETTTLSRSNTTKIASTTTITSPPTPPPQTLSIAALNTLISLI